MIAHKILVMNDGISDEDVYCFENGSRLSKEELIELLMIPHREPYESSLAYYPQIFDAFCKQNLEFDADEAEIYINKMFDLLMLGKDEEYEIYLEAFEEMWELAQMC